MFLCDSSFLSLSHSSDLSPPRPHSPQDEGKIMFDVDISSRRDSQVRMLITLLPWRLLLLFYVCVCITC